MGDLEKLQFERFLFGFFPAYQNSPLKMPWDRILPIGDSAGGQSPVSFGGFGSMVRNLKRLTLGIDEALKVDSLDKRKKKKKSNREKRNKKDNCEKNLVI